MNVTWRRAIALSCGVGLLACSIYNEDLLGDGTGGQVTCTEASECPGADTTCGQRACNDGVCDRNNSAAGTACSEDGGKVCNGQGACVECATEQDCMAGQSCSAEFTCQDGLAANGAPCAMSGACQSGSCADGVCCDTACTGVCKSCNLSGMAGTCSPAPDGSDPDADCGADSCNGAGACRCNDGVQSTGETDRDCGGLVCMPCANGMGCQGPSDCISMSCASMICGSPGCGNTNIDPGEDCDDGNTVGFDGCSASCLDEAPHLLISEVVVTPTEGEFVEIYNPSAQPQSLSQIYIADWPTYYDFTQGGSPLQSSDFVLEFPASATIAAHGFVVVSIQSATDFNTTYASMPDFDLDGTQGVPAMQGDYGTGATLTNGSEMLVLFQWNGSSDLVQDHDYVVWGDPNQGMDKSGVNVGSGTYKNETPLANQVDASSPAMGSSAQRCDTAESTETATGSNGITGHDETSEDFSTAFKTLSPPTPKAAPPAASCP